MNAVDLLLGASSEMLLLLDAKTLHIVAASEVAHEKLGYAPQQLLGLPMGDIECALSDLFFWDEMHANPHARDAQSSYRRADGSVFSVMKSVRRTGGLGEFFTVRARPMRSERQPDDALSATAAHLAATLEATTDGILLADNAGTIMNMNRRFSQLWQLPQRLLAERSDEAVVAFLQSQVVPDDSATTPVQVASQAFCVKNDTGQSTFEVLHLRDGRVLERSSQPVRDRDEQMVGRVFCYRDVTERHRTQQELLAAHNQARQASRAKGEFLAMMSHEIRTPLNGVLGLAEMLSETPLNDAQAEFVRLIRASGKTLLAVINDILDYSKIEAGKMALEVIAFSPRALLDDLGQLFRVPQHGSGPELRCEVHGEMPALLRGDPARVRQILFNLMGNAFKFTEQGAVTVSASCTPVTDAGAPVWLRFSVRDTGIGIAPERQAGVFNAFEQADAATTRRFGGTGLGLSICNRLTRLMGGEMGLVSAPGAGSEFWFTVRVELPDPLLDPAPQAATAPLVLPPELRVLVVEDHPVNQVLMLAVLKSLGVTQIVVAENGLEGVQTACQQPFDLILMDTQMPVMDGHEATRQLRAKGLRLPIVGVSAGAMQEERQAALEAGMSDYVLKPISKQVLTATLQRVLAAARAT